MNIVPQIPVMMEVPGENDTRWIPFKDITQVTQKFAAHGDGKIIRFNEETRQADHKIVISQIKAVNASLLGITQ